MLKYESSTATAQEDTIASTVRKSLVSIQSSKKNAHEVKHNMPYIVRLYKYYWDKDTKTVKHESILPTSIKESKLQELEKLLSIKLKKRGTQK